MQRPSRWECSDRRSPIGSAGRAAARRWQVGFAVDNVRRSSGLDHDLDFLVFWFLLLDDPQTRDGLCAFGAARVNAGYWMLGGRRWRIAESLGGVPEGCILLAGVGF